MTRVRFELSRRWSIREDQNATLTARAGLNSGLQGLAAFYCALLLFGFALLLSVLFIGVLLVPVALAVGAYGLALICVGVGLAARSLNRPGGVRPRLIAVAAVLPVILGPGLVTVALLADRAPRQNARLRRPLPASANASAVLHTFVGADSDSGPGVCTLEASSIRRSCLRTHQVCVAGQSCTVSQYPFVVSVRVRGNRAVGVLATGQTICLIRLHVGWEMLDDPRPVRP